MRSLEVEVYSDYTCPWCYVGWARLEKLRAELAEEVTLEVRWRPFEIHPEVPAEGMPVEDLHYTPEVWAAMMESLRHNAAAEGLEVAQRPLVANTHEALAAGTWAQTEHPDAFPAVHAALFRAYFAEGRNIGDRAVLREVVEGAGLDGAELDAALDSGRYDRAIADTFADAMRLGINGTPTFVFGGRYGTAGAQPVEVLRRGAERALAEEVSEATPEG
ncbi:MAG: DsbA family oxidoreductase [Gemmatimonadota bacterium]